MTRYEGFNVAVAQTQQSQGASSAAQQASNNVQTLSNRLESFSKQAFQIAGAMAQQEAARDATIDMHTRKQKIEKIKSTIEDPNKQQEEINKLLEGKNKSDYTIYGRAYNNTASSTYANQVALDAKEAADIAATAANGSAESFAKMFGEFKKSTVNDAPTKELAIIASRSFQQYGSSTFKSLAIAEHNKQEENDKNAYDALAKQLRNDYRMAVKNNDIVEQNEIIQRYKASSEAAISRGFTTQEEVDYEVNEVGKEAFVEITQENFRKSKDKLSFLEELRNNQYLNNDETEEVIEKLHKQIKSEIEDVKIFEEQAEENDKKFKKTAKKDLYKSLVEDTLTKEKLDKALKLDVISTTEYDDLLLRSKTPGAAESDDTSYNWYLKNMDMVTIESIYNDDSLSKEDKNFLVNRKEELETRGEKDAKEAADWEGARQGKQAIGEINRYFKIFPGTIMSKADLSNKHTQDYALIREMYYDRMESLPLEDRIPKALEIARDLMDTYKAGEIVGTKPDLDRISELEQEKVKEETLRDKPKEDDIKGQGVFMKFLNW